MKIKILHIINDLHPGGAQYALRRLIDNSNCDIFEHIVVSLTELGKNEDVLLGSKINSYKLKMNRKIPNPFVLSKINTIIRKEKPQMIHAWMYSAILVASLVAIRTKIPIIWGLHHADLNSKHHKVMTNLTIRICSIFSYSVPFRIIACGNSVRQNHITYGFDPKNIIVIPNGIDTDVFKPDPDASTEIRNELGIEDKIKLVGIASRFHPIKDHTNFLQAAELVAKQRNDVHFVLCGNEMNLENQLLMNMIRHVGLEEKCHLLGIRHDMPRIYSAWDVSVSSSLSEALPNAIIEAMSCGIPCVATDVGDTKYIVGNCGKIVPKQDPEKLAEGILNLLSLNSVSFSLLKQE